MTAMSASNHSATIHTTAKNIQKEEEEGVSDAINAEEGALPGMADKQGPAPSLILTGKKLAVVFVAM